MADNNWKSTLKEVLIPVLSTIIALAGIASGVFMQRSTNQSQVEMKKYEVTFENNQKSYADFMDKLWETYNSAVNKDEDQMGQNLKQFMHNYYLMEPFLDKNSRELIVEKIDDFGHFCFGICYGRDQRAQDQISDEYGLYNYFFRDTLCQQLFGIKPSSK